MKNFRFHSLAASVVAAAAEALDGPNHVIKLKMKLRQMCRDDSELTRKETVVVSFHK